MLCHLSMVSCNISGQDIKEAILYLEKDSHRWFLLQNFKEITKCHHKMGYKRSWWCGDDIGNFGPYHNIVELPTSPAIFALNQAIELWEALAKTGASVTEKEKKNPQWHFGCPLCHYVGDISTSNCMVQCPMWSKWVEGGGRCENIDSPYNEWRLCDDKNERKLLASKIVVLMVERRGEMLKELSQDTKDTPAYEPLKAGDMVLVDIDDEIDIEAMVCLNYKGELLFAQNRVSGYDKEIPDGYKYTYWVTPLKCEEDLACAYRDHNIRKLGKRTNPKKTSPITGEFVVTSKITKVQEVETPIRIVLVQKTNAVKIV